MFLLPIRNACMTQMLLERYGRAGQYPVMTDVSWTECSAMKVHPNRQEKKRTSTVWLWSKRSVMVRR
jgi:hypothetical protein